MGGRILLGVLCQSMVSAKRWDVCPRARVAFAFLADATVSRLRERQRMETPRSIGASLQPVVIESGKIINMSKP